MRPTAPENFDGDATTDRLDPLGRSKSTYSTRLAGLCTSDQPVALMSVTAYWYGLTVGWVTGRASGCKTYASKFLVMEVTVSGRGYSLKYQMGMKSFCPSCEDAQDKDDLRLRIKGTLANNGLPGKWSLNGVIVCMWLQYRHRA